MKVTIGEMIDKLSIINCKENITDGDLIDLGADGSFVLHNAIKKGLKGRKVGVDLIEVVGGNKAEGAEYYQGNLMNTGLEGNSFDTVISLSTIEHQVDLLAFVKECNRLLRDGGKVIVSFDFWNPKPNTEKMQLYSLDWNILDINDVMVLVNEFSNNGFKLSSPIDWILQDAVINDTYCSPVAGVSYSFGILEFIKK